MNAPLFLLVMHWLAGLFVLAEGLRRLEMLAPDEFHIERMRPEQLGESLAWLFLCLAGGGAVVTPLLPFERPTLQDACAMVGVAVLILFRRLRPPA